MDLSFASLQMKGITNIENLDVVKLIISCHQPNPWPFLHKIKIIHSGKMGFSEFPSFLGIGNRVNNRWICSKKMVCTFPFHQPPP